MKKWIFLISTLAVAYCRPQYNAQDSASVEIEKQDVVEIAPESESKQLFKEAASTQKQLEENTREILEKIAQVNEKQGLTKKKKTTYQHFPYSYSYLRSQEAENKRASDFKFSREPFSNPILDYLERKTSEDKHDKATEESPKFVVTKNEDINDEEEVPPGHYIKRKITHQQTYLIPNPAYNMPMMPNPQAYAYPTQNFGLENANLPQYAYPTPNHQNYDLERQTVNHIKNIVEDTHLGMYQNVPLYPVQNSYRIYGPYPVSDPNNFGRQQWQWPLGQYFPIVIRDPFIHMMNAFTSMIEYGPQSSQASSGCKHTKKVEENESNTSKKVPEGKKLSYSFVNNGKGAEITVLNDDDSNLTTVLELEDLRITDDNTNYRQSKQSQEISKTLFYNSTKSNDPTKTLKVTKKQISDTSPPIRDQSLFDDEIKVEVEEYENEKAEDIQHVSHDGNKKLFSKDNTGSGIFIHKIKVRKGGVAIAGPGGIATAGSGGTAIVGPNGFAYTHPDSLAIAGSGTKVVAVEPTINLADLISGGNKNKTKGHGHGPPRAGKIVAVGPVIYYNRG